MSYHKLHIIKKNWDWLGKNDLNFWDLQDLKTQFKKTKLEVCFEVMYGHKSDWQATQLGPDLLKSQNNTAFGVDLYSRSQVSEFLWEVRKNTFNSS